MGDAGLMVVEDLVTGELLGAVDLTVAVKVNNIMSQDVNSNLQYSQHKINHSLCWSHRDNPLPHLYMKWER